VNSQRVPAEDSGSVAERYGYTVTKLRNGHPLTDEDRALVAEHIGRAWGAALIALWAHEERSMDAAERKAG
jgi:hypothetical protein